MPTARIRPHHAALTLFFTLSATGVHAQAAPQPPAEIRRITALAGTFEGKATYTANGKPVTFTLHHVNQVIAGGFGLQCHEDADIPGMGRYVAEDLFGWDAGRGQLHLFSVTNDPYAHDHAGPWTDAHHATLRWEGVHDGRKMSEVLPIEIVGPDEYRFHSTVTTAGKPPETFDAVMKRVAATASR
jgi:hypothetical protein